MEKGYLKFGCNLCRWEGDTPCPIHNAKLEIDGVSTKDDKLLEDTLRLLEEIQWVGILERFCPFCKENSQNDHGHSLECKLKNIGNRICKALNMFPEF